jgi:hypothetical protein
VGINAFRAILTRALVTRANDFIMLERFASGWNRLGSFSGAGGDVPRSLRLGFLGPQSFGFEDLAFGPWILLDFLGFSRQLQDETYTIDNAAVSVAVPSPKMAVRE